MPYHPERKEEEMREKKLEDLITMYELFERYAPAGAVLLDLIERPAEYIVLYRDDKNLCTPYIIHHLSCNGLYFGRYYDSSFDAWADFDKMR